MLLIFKRQLFINRSRERKGVMKKLMYVLSMVMLVQVVFGQVIQDDRFVHDYVCSFAQLLDVSCRSGQDCSSEKYPDYIEYMTYEESASVARKLYTIKVIGVKTLKIVEKRCQRADDQKASEEGFDRVFHKLEEQFNELKDKAVRETNKERFDEAVKDARAGLQLIQDAKQRLVSNNLI